MAEGEHVDAGSDSVPPVMPAWKRRGTLYVVGVDGLSPDLTGPMAERGELPSLSRLAAEGVHGPLATVSPTTSPLIWTSIATGRHHRDHGIDGFQFYRILGFHLSRSTVRKYRKFRLRRLGFRALIAVLKLLGLRKRHYFTGENILAKTFWDIVTEAGGRAGVVNWWHSWPARPINGFVVSDKLHFWRAAEGGKTPVATHLTYPDSLLDDIRGLVLPPDRITVEEVGQFINLPHAELAELIADGYRRHDPVKEVQFGLSADRTYSQVFEHCLNAFPDLQLAAVYFRTTDIAQHCAFHYMPSASASKANAREREIFGEVVPHAYRFADELIGNVLARMRPEDSLLVLSDHGYGYEGTAGRANPYGHAHGKPPGVIYLYGKEFKRGATVSDATIYDVAPTVLRLCGFPLALELEGRSLEETLTDEFRAEHPPLEPVKTYGPRLKRSDSAVMSAEVDKKVTDHLRALGYLD